MNQTQARSSRVLLLLALLLLLTGCSTFTQSDADDPHYIKAAEGGTLSWPEYGELEVPAGALEEDGIISIDTSLEAKPMAEESPLTQLGPGYIVDLGGINQTDSLSLTMPRPDYLPDPSMNHILVRKITPGEPIIMMSMDLTEETMTIPITGSGMYQLFVMPKIDQDSMLDGLTNLREPLNVPLYPQIAPNWCSPTSLTMLAQYHQGAWPAGGIGSKWGETSSWYLTALAHQAATSGNFFHNLLRDGGYSAPVDVNQDFSNADMEVIIWNWNDAIYNTDTNDFYDKHYSGEIHYEKVEALYDAFRAYVESFFWGVNGPRKPVAWGSGMIEHSRVLTGSDGESLYYNEPGNGTQNNATLWADHHQAVLNSLAGKKEIIGTVVMLGDPRPSEELKGVIWLLPESSYTDSSITLRQAASGDDVCYWYWDGSGTRLGYYFANESGIPTLCDTMTENADFDIAFDIAPTPLTLDFSYTIFNIDDVTHDYLSAVEVYPGGEGAGITVANQQVQNVAAHSRSASLTASLPLGEQVLGGRHLLKFTLWENGILQDVKYVEFIVADYTAPLPAMPLEETAVPTSVPPAAPTETPIVIIPATLTPIILPTVQPTTGPFMIVTLAPTVSLSCMLSVPTLQSPANGAWVASNTPTLEWSYFTTNCWPDNYTVEIALDSGFTIPTYSQTATGGSHIPDYLESCNTYYWRVRGNKNGVHGDWSDTWIFSVGDPRACGG